MSLTEEAENDAGRRRMSLDELVAEVASLLHERGDRMTTSRRAVLEALHGRADHLPADDVLAVAAERHPTVHRTTVYRALEMLTGLGWSSTSPRPRATAYHLATGGAPARAVPDVRRRHRPAPLGARDAGRPSSGDRLRSTPTTWRCRDCARCQGAPADRGR
jgi:hypothetical protein